MTHSGHRVASKPLTILLALLLMATSWASDVSLAPAADAEPSTGREAWVQPDTYLSDRATPGSFPLVDDGRAAPVVVSASDHPGVVRVVADLQADVERVTDVRPAVSVDRLPARRELVLVGTIGRSPLIDDLVASGKLDLTGIAGRWETSLVQVVNHPRPGVGRALVIAGSDQRGTIYGVYDVSRQMGVSPWYWWDDVPTRHRDELFVRPGRHSQGEPAVKYRGFFINDEWPNLAHWANHYFGPGLAPGHPGGFNHRFYEKVFELMLRLRANYLWPAVWGRAFAEDDPQNHAVATAYGVVMGTSHEAPMMRGIEEWNRHASPGQDPYGGTGEWSFVRNRAAIEAYWTDGIQRMVDQDFEGVVTLGMRGPGDVGLPDGDAIPLMEDIIGTQRRILGAVTGRDPTTIPQVFTLYKEVQRYWDRGMAVPDDVTVVFADDNWGNMRKMPDPALPPRAGGYGLYYHFDYVGDGRNYKWVDTNSLPNIWEQLQQSYSYGIDRLWVANVGDLKNEELPLQFFLDYAWDPNRWPIERLPEWERRWAAQQFGPESAADIADILHSYGQLQARRKPELLNRAINLDATGQVVYDDQASPFSLVDYREIETVTEEWQELAAEVARVGEELPAASQEAYYQLVRYPVVATANLYELRLAEFKNLLYASQGRAATNDLADEAEARFAEDQALADHYNNELAGGKWHAPPTADCPTCNGFQNQPKIGYGNVARYGPNASWQQPELNGVLLPDEIFPPVQRIEVPDRAEMGVAIEGSEAVWPEESTAAVLPPFSPFQTQPAQYIEVFNRGSVAFDYEIRPGVPWVTVEPRQGRVDEEVRALVHVDWDRAPQGTTRVPLTVTGSEGTEVEVEAVIENPAVRRGQLRGFVESNGYVAMDADHYTRARNTSSVSWKRLADIGRTGSGMTPLPVTAASQTPGGASPRLDYEMTLFTEGPIDVWAYLSPRNDVLPSPGLRYAVSIDDGPPQVVDVIAATGANHTTMNRGWARNTSDNVNRTVTTHVIDEPGVHTLRFWMVDPTVVLQRLVVDTGGLAPSYLGPPESLRLTRN